MNLIDKLTNRELQDLTEVLLRISCNFGHRVTRRNLLSLMEVDSLLLIRLGKVLGGITPEEVIDMTFKRGITLKHVYWSLNVDIQ
jgi:hypothetical protein